MSIRTFLFDVFAKRKVSAGEYTTWADIKSVLLLFESDFQEKNEEIKKIVKRLLEDGKKVFACGYVHKKVAESVELNNFLILDKKSFTLWQKPKSECISKFITEKYDVVIDLSSEDCLQMKYVLLMATSKFRCGKRVERKLHDMMIDLPEITNDGKPVDLSYSEPRELYVQIERYLKMIKTK